MPMPTTSPATDSGAAGAVDVLIVGAGPTGLTLAAQLQMFGTRFRLIDRARDRVHESRALAVQARSLEILHSLGLADALVARGNRSVRLMIHMEGRTVAAARLGDFGATDTRFPFILFVSQAETEALLGEHLTTNGVDIERGVQLVRLTAVPAGVECVLRQADGREERLRARYVVGCDGAHSTVRKGAGIPFEGDAYLQDFVLGDLEVEQPLERGTIHSWVGNGGVAMFFPLAHPATWRVIAMASHNDDHDRGTSGADDEMAGSELSLPELQRMVDGATGGALALRDPVWLTHFRLHHRQAARYVAGRVFLAGDAAHIHSPVGAQGMNTGIQDAWNLGWKLALVARGAAAPDLLASYEAERWPVGRTLLRSTDRVFSLFTRGVSAGRLAGWFRREIVARLLPRVLQSRRLRAYAFHFISELGVRYRASPAVTEGRPRLRLGPKPGDRLPDARVARDGVATYLHQEVVGPRLCLLLCGDPHSWDRVRAAQLASRYAELLGVEYLTRTSVPGLLVDQHDEALRRLGVGEAGQYLVRPDGHIGFRCGGRDLGAVATYLARWFG